MVTEGYMWLFEGGPQSKTEIEALVRELLGPEKAESFWQQYRANYVTKADIHLLKQAGFNSLRVPMHYKFFEGDSTEGFKLLDNVVAWCKTEGIYVILDMHAAPGGQTGANIDDSDGYPWLYDSPTKQQELFAIWQKIAKRYANNPTVLGYDLLNEPIPTYPAVRPLNGPPSVKRDGSGSTPCTVSPPSTFRISVLRPELTTKKPEPLALWKSCVAPSAVSPAVYCAVSRMPRVGK